MRSFIACHVEKNFKMLQLDFETQKKDQGGKDESLLIVNYDT